MKPGTIRGLEKFAMIFNAEQDLHTGEVVGSIPTAPTIRPRKPRAAANAHSFLHAALSYSGERPCETGAVSGGWRRQTLRARNSHIKRMAARQPSSVLICMNPCGIPSITCSS